MPLKVKVIQPDKVLFEGEADHLMAPGVKGMLGIFPGHTPFFAELIKGEIVIFKETEELLAIESGILKVRDDVVIILIGM